MMVVMVDEKGEREIEDDGVKRLTSAILTLSSLASYVFLVFGINLGRWGEVM